jgi:hypothetical protein
MNYGLLSDNDDSSSDTSGELLKEEMNEDLMVLEESYDEDDPKNGMLPKHNMANL